MSNVTSSEAVPYYSGIQNFTVGYTVAVEYLQVETDWITSDNPL